MNEQQKELINRLMQFCFNNYHGRGFIYGVCSTNGQKPHCDDDCDNCPFPRCDDASRKDVDKQ